MCNDSVQFQMEMRKISRRRRRFVDGAELGHFTSFCRGRQRNVQKVIKRVHSYCFAHSRCRRRRGLLKVPINPKFFFCLEKSLYRSEQNGEKIFVFG